METLPRQTSLFGEDELTSLQADSHVSHTAKQGNDLVRKTSAIYGQRCLERFERFNRAGSWARTFAGLLIGMEGWSSMRCKLTWSLRGTKSNRFYFQLRGVGAPHQRERIWFVAYSDDARADDQVRDKRERSEEDEGRERFSQPESREGSGDVANTNSNGQQRSDSKDEVEPSEGRVDAQRYAFEVGGNASDSNSDERCERRIYKDESEETERHFGLFNTWEIWRNWKDFPTQPPICGRNDGLSAELDGITFSKWRNESIKAYGNAIVPQVVLQIFKAIELYEKN